MLSKAVSEGTPLLFWREINSDDATEVQVVVGRCGPGRHDRRGASQADAHGWRGWYGPVGWGYWDGGWAGCYDCGGYWGVRLRRLSPLPLVSRLGMGLLRLELRLLRLGFLLHGCCSAVDAADGGVVPAALPRLPHRAPAPSKPTAPPNPGLCPRPRPLPPLRQVCRPARASWRWQRPAHDLGPRTLKCSSTGRDRQPPPAAIPPRPEGRTNLQVRGPSSGGARWQDAGGSPQRLLDVWCPGGDRHQLRRHEEHGQRSGRGVLTPTNAPLYRECVVERSLNRSMQTLASGTLARGFCCLWMRMPKGKGRGMVGATRFLADKWDWVDAHVPVPIWPENDWLGARPACPMSGNGDWHLRTVPVPGPLLPGNRRPQNSPEPCERQRVLRIIPVSPVGDPTDRGAIYCRESYPCSTQRSWCHRRGPSFGNPGRALQADQVSGIRRSAGREPFRRAHV